MRSCVKLEINLTNKNKMKNELIIECIALLNTANYDSETLNEKRTEVVESLKEQLRIGGVSISLERAKKYARHQHFLGTQGSELAEFEDWEAKD